MKVPSYLPARRSGIQEL